MSVVSLSQNRVTQLICVSLPQKRIKVVEELAEVYSVTTAAETMLQHSNAFALITDSHGGGANGVWSN